MMPIVEPTPTTTEQIRKRLFVFLASVLLASVISVSLAVSITLFGSLKQAESRSLVRVAELRAMAIAEWCRRAKDVAVQITSRTRIRQELERYNNADISLQQLERFTKPKLQDAMHLSSEVTGILRLDAKNRIVTRCGYGEDGSLKEEALTQYVSIEPTIHGPIAIDDTLSFLVSAPIVNRRGDRLGTDLVIVGMDLLRQIAIKPEELGETSEVFIGYRSEGSIQPLFPGMRAARASRMDSDSFHAIRESILEAINGSIGVTHTGKKAIAYRPIDESDWGIVIAQNESELYAPLHRKMAAIGSMALFIYFVILFGLWVIMKPLAGRILLHASELEQKIQEKTKVLKNEIVERNKAQQEKEKVIVELQAALKEINTLSGLLPICAHCKKIRDDKGYWNHLESYIEEHSGATFTHGLCSDCAEKLYGKHLKSLKE
jgi:hypothetical protein